MDDHVCFSGTKHEKGNNIIMVITINVVRYRRKILFFSLSPTFPQDTSTPAHAPALPPLPQPPLPCFRGAQAPDLLATPPL
jgi:hypothetical protein